MHVRGRRDSAPSYFGPETIRISLVSHDLSKRWQALPNRQVLPAISREVWGNTGRYLLWPTFALRATHQNSCIRVKIPRPTTLRRRYQGNNIIFFNILKYA